MANFLSHLVKSYHHQFLTIHEFSNNYVQYFQSIDCSIGVVMLHVSIFFIPASHGTMPY